MLIDPAVVFGLALPVAALLMASALHQARGLARFASAIDAYRLLPPGAGRAAAPFLIAAETGAAIGLFVSPFRVEAALTAAALFAVYGAAIAVNLARGRRDIDCGCTFGGGDAPISAGLVLRNAALALASFAAAAPPAARLLGWIDLVSIAAAALAAAALYAGFEAVNANAAKASRGVRL